MKFQRAELWGGMKLSSIQFTIPGKPQGKQRPLVTRSGRAFTRKETVNYEAHVRGCFMAEFPGWEPLQGAVAIGIAVGVAIPRSWSKKKKVLAEIGDIKPTGRPDIDNVAKSICDALNGIAYRDDSQITYLLITKKYNDNPKVEVRIEYRE